MNKTSSIVIKKANKKDLLTVFNIVREASNWMKSEYGFTHWDEYYTLEKITENFDKKTVYILYANNIPVGTYAVGQNPPYYYSKNDISKFTEPNSPAYYPTTIAVLPKYHGNGYAKLLIKHLEKLALDNNVKYIRFDTRGDYQELISFYSKQGFTIIGELKDEDEIYYLFEKKL